MRLTPGLGVHLRGLADEVLVKDFPGATISRVEREMLATAVSAANDCFFMPRGQSRSTRIRRPSPRAAGSYVRLIRIMVLVVKAQPPSEWRRPRSP